jgi:hypothetical protein
MPGRTRIRQVENQYCPVKPAATRQNSPTGMDLRQGVCAHDLKTLRKCRFQNPDFFRKEALHVGKGVGFCPADGAHSTA